MKRMYCAKCLALNLDSMNVMGVLWSDVQLLAHISIKDFTSEGFGYYIFASGMIAELYPQKIREARKHKYSRFFVVRNSATWVSILSRGIEPTLLADTYINGTALCQFHTYREGIGN